jgi:hypothetical protein
LWRDLHRSFGSFKALHLSVHLTMAALFNGLTRAEFLQELFASCPNANLHAARNAASIEVRNDYARRIIGTGTMGFRDLESIGTSDEAAVTVSSRTLWPKDFGLRAVCPVEIGSDKLEKSGRTFGG